MGRRTGQRAGPPGRNPGGPAGGRRDHHPVLRHRRPLRLAHAAGVVRRTRIHPVPLAGHAGLGHRVPARRTHAHGRAGQSRLARDAGHAGHGGGGRGAGLSADAARAGLRVRVRGTLCHHRRAGDPQRVARRRAAGEHGADDADRAAAAGRAWPVAHHGPRAAAGGRRGRPDACAAARAGRTGQCQPADLLRRHRRRVRIRRRAHRLRLRPGDVRLPVADHRPAHDGGGGAHGRRHVAPDPAGRAACSCSWACSSK